MSEGTPHKRRAAAGRMLGLLLLGPTLGAAPAHAAVERDPGFGEQDGVVETTLDRFSAQFTDGVRTPDGKILLSGDATGDDGSRKPAVVRLNADGSLDSGFAGGQGYRLVDFADGAEGRAWGIASRGSDIVIAGSITPAEGDADMAVALLSADGTVLQTNLIDPANGRSDIALDVDVDSMGRVYVAGESSVLDDRGLIQESTGVVLRLDADMDLDPGFADQGIFERAPAVDDEGVELVNVETRDDNGKVVIVGEIDAADSGTSDFLAVQLDASDGDPDPNFGDDESAPGELILNSGDGIFVPWAMEIDGSGRLVVAGQALDFSEDNSLLAFARVLADGSGVDTSFGQAGDSAGTTILDPGDGGSGVFDLEIDSGGRIVFAGGTNDDSFETGEMLIGRLTRGGEPDADFSADGFATFDLAEGDESAFGLVLVDDETFVTMGGSSSDSRLLFFDTALALGTRIVGSESADSADGGSGGGGSLGPLALLGVVLGALGASRRWSAARTAPGRTAGRV